MTLYHLLRGQLSNCYFNNSASSRPFSRQLLYQLMKHRLISYELAAQIDPMLFSDIPIPRWYAEAGDAGSDSDVSVSFKRVNNLWKFWHVYQGVSGIQDDGARYSLGRDQILDWKDMEWPWDSFYLRWDCDQGSENRKPLLHWHVHILYSLAIHRSHFVYEHWHPRADMQTFAHVWQGTWYRCSSYENEWFDFSVTLVFGGIWLWDRWWVGFHLPFFVWHLFLQVIPRQPWATLGMLSFSSNTFWQNSKWVTPSFFSYPISSVPIQSIEPWINWKRHSTSDHHLSLNSRWN